MIERPSMRTVVALACAGALLATSVVAAAQRQEAKGRQEAAAPDTGDEEGEQSGAESEAEAEAQEVKEGGGEKVKVFEFSGLDIAGELKSPQLLYFLNRLRAEFSRPRLPHRSFMDELVRSSKSESF